MEPGNPNQLVSMVNTRGRVMWIRRWEVEDCKGQGARIILNPKEEYYPQYDQEINSSSKLPSMGGEIIDGPSGEEFLTYEEV